MEENDIVYRWINGDLSSEELSEIEKRPDFSMMKDILDNAGHFKASKYSKPTSFNELMSAIDQRPVEKRLKSSWMTPVLRIAAVLVIGIGVYFSFFNNPTTTINTLASEKTEITLPDQSEVVLNASSSLQYKSKNWDDNRILELQGEAYFKVAKGKTFTVNTEAGDVTVLGTQFNVKHRQDLFEVKCFEGRVEVKYDTILRILNPGDNLRAVGNEVSFSNHSDVEPAWIDNRSIFQTARIMDVFEELENQYGLEVQLNLKNANRIFTGGFTHDNLEEALKEITIPLNLKYTIQPDNRVIINEIQ